MSESRKQLSAPEMQLRQVGSALTFSKLSEATQSLSAEELKALDDELSYYSKTGLVGLKMSKLLASLTAAARALAA